MSTLLLVDADPLSLRVLDVSLRRAGFAVTVARDGADALAKTGTGAPDIVVTDTRLHESDGFTLVKALRERAGAADLPVVFLSSRDSAEERASARELGVDDVLLKPVFVRELLARIEVLMAVRVQRAMAETGRLTGTTDELALVDLLQSLEASRTTGVVHLGHEGQDARIYLRDGNVVDAELERMRGADVVHRTLTWEHASFRVEPGPVDNDDLLECTTHALLMRSMDRLDGVTPAPEPAAPALDTQPGAPSRERSVPSTAPWTREADSSVAPPAETDLVAAGVPRARSRTIKRVGLVAAAAGTAMILVAGLLSVRSRQAHETDLSLAGVTPPTAAAAGASQPLAPVGATGTTAAPAAPGAPEAPAAIEATPPPGADVVSTAAASVASAPSAGDPRETALDVRTELHSKSALVRDAHRALLKGDTARAILLAQQAVATNPADAEGWLTLAAARRAAGDLGGARDAYRRCVASARTFGVTSCRALVSTLDRVEGVQDVRPAKRSSW